MVLTNSLIIWLKNKEINIWESLFLIRKGWKLPLPLLPTLYRKLWINFVPLCWALFTNWNLLKIKPQLLLFLKNLNVLIKRYFLYLKSYLNLRNLSNLFRGEVFIFQAAPKQDNISILSWMACKMISNYRKNTWIRIEPKLKTTSEVFSWTDCFLMSSLAKQTWLEKINLGLLKNKCSIG